jgi:hypothetical protein
VGKITPAAAPAAAHVITSTDVEGRQRLQLQPLKEDVLPALLQLPQLVGYRRIVQRCHHCFILCIRITTTINITDKNTTVIPIVSNCQALLIQTHLPQRRHL